MGIDTPLMGIYLLKLTFKGLRYYPSTVGMGFSDFDKRRWVPYKKREVTRSSSTQIWRKKGREFPLRYFNKSFDSGKEI